jgi:hypothetical protein
MEFNVLPQKVEIRHAVGIAKNQVTDRTYPIRAQPQLHTPIMDCRLL